MTQEGTELAVPLANRLIEDLPVELLATIDDYAEDVDGLIVAIEFEGYGRVSRQDARQLIQMLTVEREKDQMASAPSDLKVLEGQANKVLKAELDKLVEQQRLLSKIANKPDDQDYLIKQTGEQLSPEQARYRLSNVVDKVLEIKKALTEEAKAKVKIGDHNFNLQVNLGESLTDALNNVRSSESFVEPAP